jgi:hypothetical protein
MPFNLQPRLENNFVRLRPLQPADFEPLYAVASDRLDLGAAPQSRIDISAMCLPIISRAPWNPAAPSWSATRTAAQVMGSSRYYDLTKRRSARSRSATPSSPGNIGPAEYNRRSRPSCSIMHFEVRAARGSFTSARKQSALTQGHGESSAALLIGEASVSYYGEPSRPNVIYRIR